MGSCREAYIDLPFERTSVERPRLVEERIKDGEDSAGSGHRYLSGRAVLAVQQHGLLTGPRTRLSLRWRACEANRL